MVPSGSSLRLDMTPVITWFYNGEPIDEVEGLGKLEENNQRLTINPTTKQHEGIYTAIADMKINFICLSQG